jgi:hypothetical protein
VRERGQQMNFRIPFYSRILFYKDYSRMALKKVYKERPNLVLEEKIRQKLKQRYKCYKTDI